MKTTVQVVLLAALLGSGSHSVAAQEGLLQPRKGESLVGTHPLSQNVQGVPLSFQTSVFLSLLPEGDGLRVKTRVVADLSELQQKADALVDTIPLPTDNCAKQGFDNIVAKIHDKKLTLNGSVATLSLEGEVEIWTCLGPLRTHTFPGSLPLKAAVPFWLVIVDPRTVAVEVGNPDVQITGNLGDLAEGILKILGVDIKREAKKALGRVINPDLLKASVPKELERLNPAIRRAELLSNSGALAATLEMDTIVTAENLGDLFTFLQNGLPAR